MKVKRIENHQECIAATNMKASSKSQNESLLKDLKEKSLWKDCIILWEDERVVARVMRIMDFYIAYLTFEDIDQKDSDEFLRIALSEFNKEKYIMHLYSDKINHEITKNALLNNGFQIIQRKISSTIKPREMKTNLTYKTLQEEKHETFLEMFEDVSHQCLDTSISLENEHLGKKEAAKSLMNELLESCDEDFWMRFYDHEVPVGFGILSFSHNKFAGIGYIGVLQSQRGNGYIKEILKELVNLCYKHHIEVLIDDSDVNNFPILNALKEVGFEKSCEELVFERKEL